MEIETAEQQSRELLQEREAHRQQSDQQHRESYAQLVESLEYAKVQVKDLTLQLGFADTKAQGLEEQLGLSDAKCKDLEVKLAGLFSAFRCTVGISRTKVSTSKPGPHKESPSARGIPLQMRGMAFKIRCRAFFFFLL